MKWQLSQVLDNAVVLPLPGEALAESLASVQMDDVVLVLALRREHALQDACIRQARAAKANIICVTNLPSRESWRGIKVLRCETRSRGPIDNHVSVLALGHLIVTRLFERSGRNGRRRLAAIETAHQNFRELAADGSAGLRKKRGRVTRRTTATGIGREKLDQQGQGAARRTAP
jgi:DNA-binding MurR/RpiR family transcriptional regulator